MNKAWIANGFTVSNAVLGGLSVMLSFDGEFYLAAACILLALVADACDGRVARALHTAGPMGVELDSLSDDISFGIASGTLMYAYQLHEFGLMGAAVCALLGAFCAFRLARFNVKSDVVHGYFEGLPCPTVGATVACYVLSGVMVWDWLALLCVLGLGILMVSEVHYPDNKGAGADQLHLNAFLFCVAFWIVCTSIQLSAWAVSLCAAYIMFGMLNTYLNMQKKKRKALRRRQKSEGQPV